MSLSFKSSSRSGAAVLKVLKVGSWETGCSGGAGEWKDESDRRTGQTGGPGNGRIGRAGALKP